MTDQGTVLASRWKGRVVLITGGLGFIGSNLACRLSSLGATVRVLDALVRDTGGDRANIDDPRIEVTIGDVRDRHLVSDILNSVDCVFHLAAAVSHTRSMAQPLDDLEHNCHATLVLLEERRRTAPGSLLVYTGSRSQYGPTSEPLVDEDHPLRPADINGIHKSTAEALVRLYDRAFGHPSVALRLSNVFGPRHQMRHAEQGFLHWFIRQAMDGATLRVFGGTQTRDFVYVDDVVDALVEAATSERARGDVFNVASGTSVSVIDAARLIVELVGLGDIKLEPFPDERAKIEIGDFRADIRKAQRILNWIPRTSFRDGLAQTIAYYREHRARYWS